MRLMEMTKRPKTAGEAKLHFVGRGRGLLEKMLLPAPIARKGRDIVLPDNPGLDFYPLKEGIQFAFESGYETWFGGTDEHAFLVRIESTLFSTLQREGEDAFFEALKPERIRAIEEIGGYPIKRQGDIFAAPLGLAWNGIHWLLKLLRGNEDSKFWHTPLDTESLFTESPFNVFGTRHRLSGLYLQVFATGRFGGRRPLLLAEGILKAPDHSPLEINGVHVLAQAEGLYYGTNPMLVD